MSRIRSFTSKIRRKIRRGIWRKFKKYGRLYLELRVLQYGTRRLKRRLNKSLRRERS